jgi:hypothetical protein
MINDILSFVNAVADDTFNEEMFAENKLVDDFCVENSKLLADIDPVFAYIAAQKLKRIADFVDSLTKEDALMILSIKIREKTGTFYGVPVTIAESKQYDYGDDAELTVLDREQKKAKAQADAIARSIKARQEILVAEGAAKELEPKLSIRVK